ncbi:MAG TPA: winged helix DNA-binding domain-containing protein [Nitriliruptorales bacterium]|nr:winged helix DNA-binding domain-containing protein [Nitriliruptorales bacterium]
MGERVLTRRDLNRAVLARQLLLERTQTRLPRAVEQLAGLQAQYTPSPYLTLSARLEGFHRDHLSAALERRELVKALLMRGTLHIVTPGDYWAFTTARQAMGAHYWPPSYERRIPQRKIADLAQATVAQLRSGPRRFNEVRTLLEPHATSDISPTSLWRRVQGHAPVVHVPPSGTWGYHGEGVYQAADTVIGGAPPAAPDDACEHLIRRYLAAFGPATKQDIAQWAGLRRIGAISQAIASMDLRTFADEQGARLYDLPDAALPDPETPAPPRLVPRFDNLMLSHADRSRVLGDVPVRRIVTKNALVHATILVDGFVVGTWQLEDGRVKLEPFTPLPPAVEAGLAEEIDRVEALVA